jgi:hypothetical protein
MVTTITQSAREIYADGGSILRNVWMGDDDDAIRMFYGEIIENDSPVMGRRQEEYQKDDQPWDPFDSLEEGVVLRKRLYLADTCSDEVWLAFVASELHENQTTLRIVVNGNETLRAPSAVATPNAVQYSANSYRRQDWIWSRWYYVQIPAEHMVAGENLIELSSQDGAKGWRIMFGDYRDYHRGARPSDCPEHSSSKSTDGGLSFEMDNLGPTGDAEGEYIVRLALRRYRRSGFIMSQVIDVSGQSDDDIKTPVQVRSIDLHTDCCTPYGSGIIMSFRWGDTPYYDAAHWSDWQPMALGAGPVAVAGRYIQWQAEMYTTNRTVSPELKSVTVQAEWQPGEPVNRMQVREIDNAAIMRSSYDFANEQYEHPKLQQLRQMCDLDDVIAGAETDWEMIQRLMRWAYLLPLPNCIICPWDSRQWLSIERDAQGQIVTGTYKGRRRDKMCLYSNVLLTQILLACGIPARHVNINSETISGHEVCEAWSNTHRKWIHLDATRDFYWEATETGEPLSTLQVHDELVRHLDKPERWDDPFMRRLADEVLKDMRIRAYEKGEWVPQEDAGSHIYQTTAHFRIVPRNDYFSRPYPLPISQGADVWGWDGYLNWADDMAPPMLHFTHHTNRPADMYWTCNQTRMTLEQTGPEHLTVHLEHDMPEFAHFEMRIGDQSWAVVKSGCTIHMPVGMTELSVRAVNTVGLPGPESRVGIERPQ